MSRNSRRRRAAFIVLRASLTILYAYSGADLILHPSGWYWAVGALPDFFGVFVNDIGIDSYLRGQGVFELLLAMAFAAWFLPGRAVRAAAAISAVQMALILLLVGVRVDTFRDIAILGNALAVFLLAKSSSYAK
ncbi:MAG: hypothetical protein HYT43_00750 [Candidatus Taylorbacteria bacterium]|nr:hypothetical protein [Candidatus Taylorbacteria bacterium]